MMLTEKLMELAYRKNVLDGADIAAHVVEPDEIDLVGFRLLCKPSAGTREYRHFMTHFFKILGEFKQKNLNPADLGESHGQGDAFFCLIHGITIGWSLVNRQHFLAKLCVELPD